MMRTIKSYVLRAGRMTQRQQQGWSDLYPHYCLPVDKGLWDFKLAFARNAPTVLEIGFGMGQSLLQMAQDQPEVNFIGVEVHQAGVGALAADIEEFALKNLRLVAFDAVSVLRDCIPDASLAGIQIFFPDPWPKKKHHKRRLIQPELVRLLTKKLQPEGYLHCATDWQDYAEHMLQVLKDEPTLNNTSDNNSYVLRPAARPLTKFEQRGQRLGHGIWDLIFTKAK